MIHIYTEKYHHCSRVFQLFTHPSALKPAWITSCTSPFYLILMFTVTYESPTKQANSVTLQWPCKVFIELSDPAHLEWIQWPLQMKTKSHIHFHNNHNASNPYTYIQDITIYDFRKTLHILFDFTASISQHIWHYLTLMGWTGKGSIINLKFRQYFLWFST